MVGEARQVAGFARRGNAFAPVAAVAAARRSAASEDTAAAAGPGAAPRSNGAETVCSTAPRNWAMRPHAFDSPRRRRSSRIDSEMKLRSDRISLNEVSGVYCSIIFWILLSASVTPSASASVMLLRARNSALITGLALTESLPCGSMASHRLLARARFAALASASSRWKTCPEISGVKPVPPAV